MAYEDLEGLDGTFENVGGTNTQVFFAPKSDFETIAPPPEFNSGAALGDDVVITTDHVMKTGKKLLSLSMLQDSGKLTSELVGDLGGKSDSVTFEAMYVGAMKQIQGMRRRMKNDQFLFFIALPDGTVIQIGTEDRPAMAEAGFDSGTAKEGVRSMSITVNAVSQATWIYEGTLPLTPAV